MRIYLAEVTIQKGKDSPVKAEIVYKEDATQETIIARVLRKKDRDGYKVTEIKKIRPLGI